MALTRAQQAKQMLQDGGMLVKPPTTSKRPGYRSAKAQEAQGRSSGPAGGASSGGNYGGNQNTGGGGNNSVDTGDLGSEAANVAANVAATRGDGGGRTRIQEERQEAFRKQQLQKLVQQQQEEKAFEPFESLIVRSSNLPGPSGMLLNATIPFRQKTLNRNVDYFRGLKSRGKLDKPRYSLTAQGYKNYMSDRLAGIIDASGNPLNQDDDNNNIILPMDTTFTQAPTTTTQAPTTTDPVVDESEETEEPFQLSRRFRAEGGIMNADVVGGEFDFESARQMYGLGKLVKKVTRTVKKIAKSPVGKAALLYAGGAGLGALGTGTGFAGFKAGLMSPSLMFRNLATSGKGFLTGISKGAIQFPGASVATSAPGAFKLGEFFTTGKGIATAITAASVLPLLGLGTGEEDEEEAQEILRGEGLDLQAIRDNPNQYLGRRFRAEGGSMKEPVAKKTMPLLDLEGKEMDLRAEGGFVPIGRMEKADDVPARLSKNEFVFTADAVRNAGDGDVDKGAEVMYNMMKNLESGGDVSEESQGLEGARAMFQTSKRLEEVL